jgi:hypothetical protein
MNQIHLPKQHLAAISDPPSIEKWAQLCREASDDELVHLRTMALSFLAADGVTNQRWSIYISIVEGTLREHSICRRH